MAGGIFDALAEDMNLGFRSQSAGVAALVREPAAPHAVRAMEELGIGIGGHRARQVNEAMIRSADLVLAMTPQHRETLHRNFPEFREKIHTLPEYSTGAAAGIADPYGYDFSVYRTSAREILRHVELVLERLKSEQRTSDT
jgi:protein-tyrosine-phosphatase